MGLRWGGFGGGGESLGPQINTFGDSSTADKAASAALRDTYAGANADWLALYNASRAFYILLQWDDGKALQRRNAAGDDWEDLTGVIEGPRGPGPSDAQIMALVKPYARTGSTDQIPDGDIPDAITRDAEITSGLIVNLISGDIAFSDLAGMIDDGQIPAAVLRDAELTLSLIATTLGLTTTEAEQILVGAPTLSGQDLTFTLSDGSAVTRTLPQAAGSADGRLRFGVGDPATTLGIDGDTYVNLSTGEAWEKSAGSWTEHGTFSFVRLLQMSRTRYATLIAARHNPTEAEWLAGNTSMTDHIDLRPQIVDSAYKAFAIPAWQGSLTTMMQASGIFNERGLYTPAQNDNDVLQDIAGISCKTYVAADDSGRRAFTQTWILRPAPP